MAKGPNLFVALVTLIVGALIGWFLASKPQPMKQKAGGHIIRVDKDGKPNKEEVELNKDDHDVAFWIEDEHDKNLYIEFKDNAPFDGMTQTPDGRWRVHCVDYTCFSGEIQQGAQGGGTKYRYWKVVKPKDGSPGKEDNGWIVIRP
jgi:hypothetical protein